MAVTTQPVTFSILNMTKARVLQAAIKEDRSLSSMTGRLLELGLKAYWDGFEPHIADAEQFLETNKKSKSNE